VNFKTLPLLLFFFCCSCDVPQQQELPKNEIPEKVQDKELHAELPVKKPLNSQEKKPSKALPVGQDRKKSFHDLESSTIQGKARHDYPPENLLE
jgi:hypothetical protein